MKRKKCPVCGRHTLFEAKGVIPGPEFGEVEMRRIPPEDNIRWCLNSRCPRNRGKRSSQIENLCLIHQQWYDSEGKCEECA